MGGAEGWRHNKTDFAHWVKEASTQPNSKAKREFYGYLQMAFGDVDVDKDGKINAQEFDYLCEKVAAMPRRFGFAPSWESEYGGSIEKRTAARKAMFDAVDSKQGAARGWIGAAQFTDWATTHIAGKIAEIDTASEVDFYHVANYAEADFLKAIEVAVTNKNSREYASLYEFLLTAFVETDATCRGEITYAEFNKLIFESMDDTKTGLITFRKFLEWTVTHTAGKVEAHKAGKGYKK